MRKMTLLMFVVLTAVLASSFAFAGEKTFKAKLTPKEEMISLKSKASGAAEFKLSKDGKTLSYKLRVKNITDASAAHIHKGKKGEAGAPLVALFAGERKGKFSGTLAEGTITEKDLLGDLQGKPLDELLLLIKAEDVYVNVHTEANPDGEIRGQVK
jgi:Cu/Zn superoxide dismutase